MLRMRIILHYNNNTLIIKHLESLLKAVLYVDEHFTRNFAIGNDDSGGREAGNIKFLPFTFFSSSALSHYVSGHETQTQQTHSITNKTPRRLNNKNFFLLIHLQQTRSERWDEKKMKMYENISFPFPALIENSHSALSVLWLVCLSSAFFQSDNYHKILMLRLFGRVKSASSITKNRNICWRLFAIRCVADTSERKIKFLFRQSIYIVAPSFSR